MNVRSYILFGLLGFAPWAFSVTLLEGVTAAGIQNTLSSTATTDGSAVKQQIIDKIKKAERQEQNKQKQIERISNSKDPSLLPPSHLPQIESQPEMTSQPTTSQRIIARPIQSDLSNPPHSHLSNPPYSSSKDRNLISEKNPSSQQIDSLSSDELDQKLNDEGISIDSDKVDYTKSTAIFYKNNCKDKDSTRSPSQTCTPIPVLTNIKSVIFNYAHSRGEFEEKAK